MMENLSLSDSPLAGSPNLAAMSSPNARSLPQLPPQMFTTAAQLLDLTDKKLLVSLRDGRRLIGVLRSWDQFANLFLQSTIERIFVTVSTPPPSSSPSALLSTPASRGFYADIPRGLYLVRGENVVLLGEIDLEKDDESPPGYERAEEAVVRRLIAEKKAAETPRDYKRIRRLAALGFEAETAGEIVL